MRGILASRSVRVKLNNELRVTRILCSIAALTEGTEGDRREVSLSLKCPIIISQASLVKQISENVPSSSARVVGLPGLAPLRAPQSTRREDEGEAPERAERPECPHEEEAAGGLGDLAVVCPPHVDDGHACC
jgi:hypothetical protein